MGKPSTQKLEPALVFLRELWALDHALGSASKRMHDRIGITAQQRMMLRFVEKWPGITAGELAEVLHVERSTLSLALKRLCGRKLIRKTVDRTDKRQTFLSLTPSGRRFTLSAHGTVERGVARTLQATKHRDLETIRAFLQTLVANLEE